jgi:selenide,water dikinase
VLQKLGLQPGDALVLTKPIGTGTLLAANMRGTAKARWIAAAMQHMIQSNRDAARILRNFDVHAATDVTGFGLLGHLVEMVRASGVDATIAIDRIPLLDGASETIKLGIFSSLQPQNVRLRRAIRALDTVASHPRYPLLFDPQTAGGLLAAVPIQRSQACIAALRSVGCTHASIIGVVLARGAELAPIAIDLDGGQLQRALDDSLQHPVDQELENATQSI